MIRILIADDHSIVREGLKQILADEFPKAIFGEAQNAAEVLDLILTQKWDVAIMDISMPGRGGLEILRELKQHKANIPVLILSMYPEDQYAMRALKGGASGYLTKESAPDELVRAIKQILSGRKYVSQSLAEKLASSLGNESGDATHESLSDREYEVLCLIASGKTVSEIGEAMSLSVKTISTYRSRILSKMKMKTNAELMRYAVERGLMK